MVLLEDLGDDLLVTLIPQYLHPRDTFNLSVTCHSMYRRYWYPSSPIYKTMYNQMFTNNDNNYTIDSGLTWEKLFRIRTNPKQKVFTWGSGTHRRLGYDLSEVPFAERNRTSIYRPRNIPQFNNHIILDIRATGYSFIILTESGELFYTGWSFRENGGHHTPSAVQMDQWTSYEDDSVAGNLRGRQGVVSLRFQRHNRDDETAFRDPPSGRQRPPNANLEQTPEALGIDLLNPMSGFSSVHQPSHEVFGHQTSRAVDLSQTDALRHLVLPIDTRVISIQAGRSHVIALDDSNRVFQWDTTTQNQRGVQLQFPTSVTVDKIRAGWNLAGYYSVDEGIRLWYGRESITPVTPSGHIVNAFSVLVPHTNQIDDFAVMVDSVLYIQDGKLYKADAPAHEWSTSDGDPSITMVSPVDAYNQWMQDYNAENGTTYRFTRISCTYRNFVLFTDGDQVIVGRLDRLHQVQVDEKLQKRKIKSVVMGDYHFLALTSDGDCLAWGLESQNCGCLGLGLPDDVANTYAGTSTEDGRALLVREPVVVPPPSTPGKWVQLAASGWQSGGIFV